MACRQHFIYQIQFKLFQRVNKTDYFLIIFDIFVSVLHEESLFIIWVKFYLKKNRHNISIKVTGWSLCMIIWSGDVLHFLHKDMYTDSILFVCSISEKCLRLSSTLANIFLVVNGLKKDPNLGNFINIRHRLWLCIQGCKEYGNWLVNPRIIWACEINQCKMFSQLL